MRKLLRNWWVLSWVSETQLTNRMRVALQVEMRWAGDANIALAVELPAGGEATRMVPKITDLQVRAGHIKDGGSCLGACRTWLSTPMLLSIQHAHIVQKCCCAGGRNRTSPLLAAGTYHTWLWRCCVQPAVRSDLGVLLQGLLIARLLNTEGCTLPLLASIGSCQSCSCPLACSKKIQTLPLRRQMSQGCGASVAVPLKSRSRSRCSPCDILKWPCYITYDMTAHVPPHNIFAGRVAPFDGFLWEYLFAARCGNIFRS